MQMSWVKPTAVGRVFQTIPQISRLEIVLIVYDSSHFKYVISLVCCLLWDR